MKANIVFAWKFGRPICKYSEDGKLIVVSVAWDRIALNMDDPSNPQKKSGQTDLLPPQPNTPFISYSQITKQNIEAWVVAAMNATDSETLAKLDAELSAPLVPAENPEVDLPFEDEDPVLDAMTQPKQEN